MGKIYNELVKANEEAQRLGNRTKEALSKDGFVVKKDRGVDNE